MLLKACVILGRLRSSRLDGRTPRRMISAGADFGYERALIGAIGAAPGEWCHDRDKR
jgi:hypothetical protein